MTTNIDTTSHRELSTVNNQAARKLEKRGCTTISQLVAKSYTTLTRIYQIDGRDAEAILDEARTVAKLETARMEASR